MSEINSGQPVIFGEVLFDVFEEGESVLGGAPFNVAWHLQAFGCTPLLISRVGDDIAGEQVHAAMHGWGMQTTGLQVDPQRSTGQVCVQIEKGEPAYDIVTDQAYDAIDAADLPDVESLSLVYHGSLALRGQTTAAALKRLLERYQPPVFLDINLRPPWWQLETATRMLSRADWLKLNEHELAELLQADMGIETGAAKLLQQHDLSLLVITQGEKGAYICLNTGESFSVAPEGVNQVVDTVGAGDAFTSVCILGLLQGWDLRQTMPRAQRFAAAMVGVHGATIADKEFYAAFMYDWNLG